jgi:hypothetical protein
VLQILEHDFSDTENKLWLVQWYGEDPPSSSWENHVTLKAFHQYCSTHRLNAFLQRNKHNSRHQGRARNVGPCNNTPRHATPRHAATTISKEIEQGDGGTHGEVTAQRMGGSQG